MRFVRHAFCLLALPLAAFADVRPAPLFRDGAVLQRDMPAPVWGEAAPGEAIVVEWRGARHETVADAQGRWRVVLPPMPASAAPSELLISGKTTVRVRDVLVGELWLCSGQSNMAWTVAESADAAAEIAAADFPLVRHFQVAKTVADRPAFSVAGAWEAASPKTVGDFSGVAYFFGRELHRRLGVPVGLINASWGSTHIESWMSPAALASDPAFESVHRRWAEVVAGHPAKLAAHAQALAAWDAAGRPAKRRPRSPDGPGSRLEPSGLHKGMIHPFTPAALRGVIWYQGETNSARHEEYARLFTRLIESWRAEFAQPELPFYFVQLANNIRRHDPSGEEFSHIREAQRAALALPATGMAVTIDIGDPRDIHPANKQDVGRRLALLALRRIHGLESEDSGPLPAGAGNEKSDTSAVRVGFSHSAGLATGDPALPGFEVAGADGVFFDATARLEDETAVVRSARVGVPTRVRYAWGNNPPSPLRNGAGLPASPFVVPVTPTGDAP
jgi:sialate O-acetylesterase